MAFEATTPFAIACLTDKAKAKQSYTILTADAPIEVRAKNLLGLAKSWNVAMTSHEAYQVVAEADRVVQASGSMEAILLS